MNDNGCGCGDSVKKEPVEQNCGCGPVTKETEKSGACGCSAPAAPITKDASSCGCGTTAVKTQCGDAWITGAVEAGGMSVPQVATTLSLRDKQGTWKARWGMGRMDYMVNPGLYAAGKPDAASPVFVSANYKMSFDALRSSIDGIDAWILVIDTKGINVWCAAGKGTFGTDELVNRIKTVRLDEVVEHRRIILPQLGAPGVSAHEVKARSGFKVKYGPVWAKDLPEFMKAGMKATPEMREVTFPFVNRITLAPVELIFSVKYLMYVLMGAIVIAGIGPKIFSIDDIAARAPMALLFLIVGYVSGTVLTPALLPYLPGRSFSAKGAGAGLLAFAATALLATAAGKSWTPMEASIWIIMTVALSSFLGMNFTGSSTYTSLSGVRKEMRRAVPIQLAGFVVGIALWIASAFI